MLYVVLFVTLGFSAPQAKESVEPRDAGMNLEEILHIRETLIRAELDRLRTSDERFYSDLVTGKVTMCAE